MKDFERIGTCFTGEDLELERQLDCMTTLLKRTGCTAVVQYDLDSKGMVATLFKGCKEIKTNIDLDAAYKFLKEKADAEEAYRRKVFVGAAEVAAYYNAETHVIRKGDEYFDYNMKTRVDGCLLQHYHSKILDRWVSSTADNDGWIDAFTGEIYSALDIFDDSKQK